MMPTSTGEWEKWRPPSLKCEYLAEGKMLFKGKEYAAAATNFRKCLENLTSGNNAAVAAITNNEDGDGASSYKYTVDEIVISTRLFLLRALWIQAESDVTYVDQTLSEVHSILLVITNANDNANDVGTTTTDCECRFVLLTIICFYIARIANDELIQNGSKLYTSEEISNMGIKACRIILDKSMVCATNNTFIKERRTLYAYESVLHERNGDLEAAAKSTLSLLQESPNVQQHKKRLRELHIRLGVVDVDAERAQKAATALRRKNEKKSRQDKRAAILGDVLDKLEPEVLATLSRPPTYNFFSGLENQKCIPVNNSAKDDLSASIGAIDWSSIPSDITPIYSNKNKDRRLRRKKNQLEALYTLLRDLVEKVSTTKGYDQTAPLHIVDFGSGSGNSCLVFAYLLLQNMDIPCRFTLIDNNPKSVALGKERTIKAGLDSGVSWLCLDVGDFTEDFDIGLATHLCGGATDVAMRGCLLKQASFIATPCCLGALKWAIPNEAEAENAVVSSRGAKAGRGYGFTGNGKGNSLIYPRSICFREKLSVEYYADITRLADCSLAMDRSDDELQMRGKAFLDSDRLRLAMEAGYDTSFGKLGSKADCGPKSDVLCGICYDN